MSGTSIQLFSLSRALYVLGLGFVMAAFLATAVPALGAEEDEDDSLGTIEEIVVTSEKRESTAQDTGLALSAFDENALDRENIDDALDIQFSVPNLLFSKTNFTGARIAIRGIGNNAVAASSDSGTGVHFNGFYQVATGLFESEFYDVARVEILRGPQGTLYGRNTTAGVVNIISNKPAKEFKANGEMEFGDYGTRKIKTAVNLPITNWFQVRTALFRLKRDGYVLNESTGNLIDDRDVVAGRWSFRLGGEADGPFELNVVYDHFLEDDSRLRQSKQLCHQDLSPYPYNLGCLPGQSLYEGDRFGSPTYFSTIAGFLSAIQPLATVLPEGRCTGTPLPSDCTFYPAVPLASFPAALGIGQPNISDVPSYNPQDLRSVNQLIDPYYKVRDRVGTATLKWDLGSLEFNLVAGRQRRDFYSNNDYNGSTGGDGEGVFFNPTAVAVWNAAVAGGICNDACQTLAAGGDATAIALAQQAAFIQSLPFPFSNDPILTGHGQSTNGRNQLFAWDYSGGTSDNQSTEIRLSSNFDSNFNFMVGNFDLDYESSGAYEVHSNMLAAFSPSAPDLGYYNNDTALYELDSQASFLELYFGNENLMLTLGARSTEETKKVRDRQTLLNDPDLLPVVGLTGRACLNSPLSWLVGGWGSGGGCVNGGVPTYRIFSNSWNEDTWKLGLDIKLSDGSLMYVTAANSYKSGGLNPPAFSGAFPETFGPEYIDSLEVGFKNSIGGKANVNLTFFYYDYKGLQISKIVDRTSVNENIDAINSGIELEVAWAPTRNWRFDFTASKLDTEIQGGSSINPADPANAWRDGDPESARFRNRKNGDTSIYLEPQNGYTFSPADCNTAMEGGTLQCANIFTYRPTGVGAGSVHDACVVAGACTAVPDGTTPTGTDLQALEQQASNWLSGLTPEEQLALTITCPAAVLEASLEGASLLDDFGGEGIAGAGYCGAALLGALPTDSPRPNHLFTQAPIGIAVDLTGNQLPNAPEQSARLGMQYNIDLDGTNLALRADYYWQSDFYYRIFNTRQDLVESWNVLNLQASLSSLSGDWTMELWVKNARDKDHVTGAYFTDASSGNYTNLFLLEPRTVGISFKFRY